MSVLVVTLRNTKRWLRVDGNYENALIRSYILLAEDMVEDILRFPLAEFGKNVPEPIKQAIYFCVSKFYEERNELDMVRLNQVLVALLSSYRQVKW